MVSVLLDFRYYDQTSEATSLRRGRVREPVRYCSKKRRLSPRRTTWVGAPKSTRKELTQEVGLWPLHTRRGMFIFVRACTHIPQKLNENIKTMRKGAGSSSTRPSGSLFATPATAVQPGGANHGASPGSRWIDLTNPIRSFLKAHRTPKNIPLGIKF